MTAESYEVSLEQAKINERSALIRANHETELVLVTGYETGVAEKAFYLDSFANTKRSTDNLYLAVNQEINKLSGSIDQEEITQGLSILANLTSLRDGFYDRSIGDPMTGARGLFNRTSLVNIDAALTTITNITALTHAVSTHLMEWIVNPNTPLFNVINDELFFATNDLLDVLTFQISLINETDVNLGTQVLTPLHSQTLTNFTQVKIDAAVIFSVMATSPGLDDLSESEYNTVTTRINNIFTENNNIAFALRQFAVNLNAEKEEINGIMEVMIDDLRDLTVETSRLTLWSNGVLLGLENEFNTLRDVLEIVIFFVLFISAVFVIGILYLINREITRPIQVITQWSQEVSSGQLTRTIKSTKRLDEVGILQRNFKNMTNNLREIISELKITSELVSTTTEELSSNTQEINATAEEVSAIATSMAKGSTQQAELISNIVEELNVTSEIVDNVINQINGNLIVIRDLSEQTNILALNTAIEAANAGEFGRGFVVIADNIRKMATSSKKTTEQVTKDSEEILDQLQKTFSNVQSKIENIASVSEETAASAEEVAASAEEMTATMQSVSATSAVLNDHSFQSLKLVNQFVIDRDDERGVFFTSEPKKKAMDDEDESSE